MTTDDYIAMAKQAAEAPEEGAVFTAEDGPRKIPYGVYVVEVQKVRLGCVEGMPTAVCQMQILNGEHKDGLIVLDQPMKNGFQIHLVNEFLRGLCKRAENRPEVRFRNFGQYGLLMMGIEEMICPRFTYEARFYSNFGFDAFEVTPISDKQEF